MLDILGYWQGRKIINKRICIKSCTLHHCWHTPYRGAAQLLRTVLEGLRSSWQRTASSTVPSLRSVNERVEHAWNTNNLCVLSSTQLLHVSALSAHLQPSDSNISSKRTETKYVTISVHAECCEISSAELYRCHLTVDGQIIRPKHVTGMQKTVRIVPYRYNSICTPTVTSCVAVCLKKIVVSSLKMAR